MEVREEGMEGREHWGGQVYTHGLLKWLQLFVQHLDVPEKITNSGEISFSECDIYFLGPIRSLKGKG